MTEPRSLSQGFFKVIILLLMVTVIPVCAKKETPAPQDTAKKDLKPPKDVVTVYYFHTTHRCPTCNMFEGLAKAVVEKDFADKVKTNQLAFEPVNIDEAGNKHFVQDYKLYTKSVIISVYKDGKEVSWKNLDKLWELARDRDKLREYLHSNIAEALKG